MIDARSHDSLLVGVDVFVGGPIQHALRGDKIIDDVHDPVSLAIHAITRAGGNVFSAHVAESFGKTTALFTPSQVAVRDFRWMNKCDVFVPILPVDADGALIRTDGTHVELGWASALGRPIVLISTHPLSNDASHLLKGLPCVSDLTVLDIEFFLREPDILAKMIADIGTRNSVNQNYNNNDATAGSKTQLGFAV